MLEPINFTTKPPVVIVNTNAQGITRTAVNSTLCTCSQGLKKGDLNTTVGFRQRGGTNSRKSLKLLKPTQGIAAIAGSVQHCHHLCTMFVLCNLMLF